MPIYEFECKDCDTVFEKLVFSSHKEKIVCANCQSTEIQKLISATGLGVSKSSTSQSVPGCQARSGFS